MSRIENNALIRTDSVAVFVGARVCVCDARKLAENDDAIEDVAGYFTQPLLSYYKPGTTGAKDPGGWELNGVDTTITRCPWCGKDLPADEPCHK